MLKTAFSVEALHESFMEIRKDIAFKYKVQEYRIRELAEIAKFREAYANGTYKMANTSPFWIKERGYERYITPIAFSDRVVIHSFCKNVLIPKFVPSFIYDNGASLKNKGVDHALGRMRTHLQRYYRKHNSNKGYILKIDVSKYFDNLRHDKILELFSKKLTEEELAFLKIVLDSSKIDVSYMTDEEYDRCMDETFNGIEYYKAHHMKTGEKMMDKSVGIGSETSQIIGLAYLSAVDKDITIVRGFGKYSRYTDDTVILHHNKEELKALLEDVKEEYAEVGLKVSEKKTQIIRIDKPFLYLKTWFVLTDTGKVVMRKHKDVFTRERRKLKKLKQKMDNGEIPYKSIEEQYRSWRGTIMRKRRDPHTRKKTSKLMYHNIQQVRRMDGLFNEQFIKPFIYRYG